MKITRNTPLIHVEINDALIQNGITATQYNVRRVWNNYMQTGCGEETDILDALAATFGGDIEDYE